METSKQHLIQIQRINIALYLYEALIKLYEEYGFTKGELISIELQGKEGQEKIANCLNTLRKNKLKEIA